MKKQPFGQNIAESVDRLTAVLSGAGGHYMYGFHVNSNESDPEDCITYLKDAIGMTPCKMDYASGKFNWGSWKDAFFMPKPCMLGFDGKVKYYLDPNNYAKKMDGTASDITNMQFEGNAMMEWGANGKIWYKIVPDEGDDTSYSFYVADYKADDEFRCYNHFNKNDVMMNTFYTPCYSGSLDSSNRLRSMSGQSIMHTKSGMQEITYAKANGDGWNIECWADKLIMFMLLYLIGHSLDVQTTFGRGHDSGGSSATSLKQTGELDQKGMFWGSNNGTDKVKVFGMEDQWSEQWNRMNGIMLENGVCKYKLTEGLADGSERNGYPTTDTEGMIIIGSLPIATGHYVKKMKAIGHTIIPWEGDGGSTTNYCDFFWKNESGVRFALVGGSSYNGSGCGFALALNNVAGDASWNLGAAPSYKPLQMVG